MFRPNISSYVVNRKWVAVRGSNDGTSFDDIMKMDIDFPYRKEYKGDASVKISLEHIFDIEPIIRREEWSIPDGKIISKVPIFKKLYYLSKIVVTSVNNHWDYDQIIDYYSEEARVKTPGYGEKYSPYEYWKNKDLHSRWLDKNTGLFTLETVRELIYKNIQEARPAYALVSKSLYAALMEFNKVDSYTILDIAAYGERAIAAASLRNVVSYDGVDPNYDLISGHDSLIMDLELLNPNCNIRFIHVGLEDYRTSKKYDIITYSPPPFNTEPYGNNQESQSYVKYPTFDEYFCCFLTELIYKAKSVSYKGKTVFAFTALDRIPIKFPPRIRDKKQISENLELVYVEALLLVISCFGFLYQGAIGLAAGGKQAGVPWWTFKYTETFEAMYMLLLREHYSNIYNIIAPRLISNYHSIVGDIHPSFESIHVVKITTDKYLISSYFPKKTNVILELIRMQCQQYVIEVVTKLSGLRTEKVRVLLGRYLMMRSIKASYQKPWMSCLYVDPVFPTYQDDLEIRNQIISYLIEQRVNKELSNKIINEYRYWFGSYECIGITRLYDTIANFVASLPISKAEYTTSKKGNTTVINLNDYAKNLFRKIIPRSETKKYEFNVDIKKYDDIESNLLPYLRYETLGAHGHQYTRPSEKTALIEEIFGMPVIDIYASIYNNQSKKYCSIYPDVEPDSIGSAFCLRMIEGAYLANPVDVPVFLNKSINIIIEDLHRAKMNNKTLLISMAFTVWTDTEHYFIEEFGDGNVPYSTLFKKSKNNGLNMLADCEFIIAVYILDKKKFPSVLLDKVGSRDNTISVGVMLGSQNKINDNLLIQLVEDKKYIKRIHKK